MRSIIALTDLGPGGDSAIRVGVGLAEGHGAELHVVHGMNLIGLSLREAFGPLHAGVIQRSREALDDQVREAGVERSVPINGFLDARSGGRAVTELASELDAGLIVLGREPGVARQRLVTSELGLQIALESGARVLITGGALCWPPRTVRSLGGVRRDVDRDEGAELCTPDLAMHDASTDLLTASGDNSAIEQQALRWLESGAELDLLLIPDSLGDELPDELDRSESATTVSPVPG